MNGNASVDVRALQGCEARSSKRQKNPHRLWISASKQEARRPSILRHTNMKTLEDCGGSVLM